MFALVLSINDKNTAGYFNVRPRSGGRSRRAAPEAVASSPCILGTCTYRFVIAPRRDLPKRACSLSLYLTVFGRIPRNCKEKN